MTVLEIVLGATSGVLALTVAVTLYQFKQRLDEIETDPEFEVDQDKVRGAVSESWQKLKLDKKIGSVEKQMDNVEKQAEKMQDLHQDIEAMMANPQERGEFGERKLEDMLSHHLPDDMFGLQEQVVGHKKPDAYIESSSGKICIDSKFPLDRFKEMNETEDEQEADRHAREFRKAVKNQLKQVEKKYVKPEKGTTEYAFEFVPSERVYYYLVKEEYTMLREFSQKGVQVVSPLTLGHKLELVKSDVQTAKLSKEAQNVKEQLQTLENRFKDVFSEWEVFYKHVKNSRKKADDVEKELENLEDDFRKVNNLDS